MKNKKPTGPRSAYICFLQCFREKYKTENPDIKPNFAEISKLGGTKWKSLSEPEKKEFIEMAETDKKRYADEMASYEPEENDVKNINKKKKLNKVSKAPKDPNKPKRPMSAFMLFSAEFRLSVKESNPELKLVEVSKELGKMWKDCKEKDKYENMAKLAKEKYENEIQTYDEEKENSITFDDFVKTQM